MIIDLLISLSEGVMVVVTGRGVSVSTEIWLVSLLLLDFNCYTFNLQRKVQLADDVANIQTQNSNENVTYLVILHPDFNFKFWWHYELISFN